MAEPEKTEGASVNETPGNGLDTTALMPLEEVPGTAADAATVEQAKDKQGSQLEDIPPAAAYDTPHPPPEQSLINELKEVTNFWLKWAHICIKIHWSVGLIGATTATLAASSQFIPEATATFAVISAICFSIIGFVNPQKRASKFLASYRLLDPAIREYKFKELSRKSLLQTHVKAEHLLGDGEFDGK
jgi:hypothetical protein